MSESVFVVVLLTGSALALVVAVLGILRWRRMHAPVATRRDTYREVRRLNLYRFGGLLGVLTLGGAAAALTPDSGWAPVVLIGLAGAGWALWAVAFARRDAQCAVCRYAAPCPHGR